MTKLRASRFLGFFLSCLVGALAITFVAYATSVGTNVSVTGTLTTTGVTTLTGSLQASSTALFTGNITTYGNATFGDAAGDLNLFTGTLQASSTALFGDTATFYGNLTVDKAATTTVTFNQAGLNFDSNTLVIDPNANRVGVLTATPGTSFEVNGTASTTNLVVGGNGSTIAGIVFGFCNLSSGTITASTTKAVNCTSATGVRTSDRVFVMATSSLPTNLILLSASSSATDTISLYIHRLDLTGGATATGNISINFISLR